MSTDLSIFFYFTNINLGFSNFKKYFSNFNLGVSNLNLATLKVDFSNIFYSEVFMIEEFEKMLHKDSGT